MAPEESIKLIGWLGESWGFWIQTGAFFASAIAGIGVIYYNGRQSRTRALIDLIIHQKTDKDLISATQLVYKLQRENKSFSAYAPAEGENGERRSILLVLNNYEFIAVGIREKVFDEKIYKEMQCSNVLKVWDAARGFVHELRRIEQKETIFQDFECLAERWKKTPIKQIKK